MYIDFLRKIFEANHKKDALIWQDTVTSYGRLLKMLDYWEGYIKTQIKSGAVISLETDFSPVSVVLLLALIEHKCIIVPLTDTIKAKKEKFRKIAQVETIIKINRHDQVVFETITAPLDHPLLLELKQQEHPGLILFSSGSTGESKAALHDFVPLLEKFKEPRHSKRTINFLLFDHIGGINTLLYTLSNSGCIITLQDRSPDTVCSAIEKHKADILPTSPTFINLILLSEAYKHYDISNLELVTYGTEVMPDNTLKRFHMLFPNVRLLQTYGLSEVGILRSKSKSSESLWVKVGGEGFKTRVVDGMLEIKAQSAMLGYLNAPSPFTQDDWFKTGDSVEVDGEYIRILGRKSEIINVGGEKVYPAEVENALLLMDGVKDVTATAEPNQITGNVVKVFVELTTDETARAFKKRMRAFCKERLLAFKIPQRVVLVEAEMHGERFKKLRNTLTKEEDS